jgi:hypothetical protein
MPSTRLPPGLVGRTCRSGPNVIVLHATTPVRGPPRYIIDLVP